MCSANALLTEGWVPSGKGIWQMEQRFSPLRSVKCGPIGVSMMKKLFHRLERLVCSMGFNGA
jgi:hypothetical protein